MRISEFLELLGEKLHEISDINWKFSTCKNCGSGFFFPSRYRDHLKEKNIPSLRNVESYLSLSDLYEIITDYFKNKNYKIENPMEIIHKYKNKQKIEVLESTLFTVAGVQLIDKKIPTEPTYIPQPSIRLKWLKNASDISPKKPYSTSLVNITTLKATKNLDDFFVQFKDWLEFLDQFNLLKKSRLVVKNSKIKWGKKHAKGIFVKLEYYDVELGDLGFIFDFPFENGRKKHLIDIGFGLERLGYVINHTPSYFDVIGPLFLSSLGHHILIDHLRTLTLAVGSGVSLKNTIHGKKLSKLITNLVDCGYYLYDFLPLEVYYYNFWKRFVNLPVKPSRIDYEIKREVYRKINRKIVEKIGLKKYLSQTDNISFVELGDLIMKEGKIKPERIKKIISELYLSD